jgi:hypothetical protein
LNQAKKAARPRGHELYDISTNSLLKIGMMSWSITVYHYRSRSPPRLRCDKIWEKKQAVLVQNQGKMIFEFANRLISTRDQVTSDDCALLSA